MNANVRDVPAWPDELCTELECLRDTNGFDCDVGTQAVGELLDHRNRILVAVVDRHVGAESLRLLEPRVGEVDHDDTSRRVELCRHHSR